MTTRLSLGDNEVIEGAAALLEEIREELKKRKLYKSDRHFSVYWLGGSTAYWSMMRDRQFAISPLVLVRLSDKLIAHGMHELGAKLFSTVMNEIRKS